MLTSPVSASPRRRGPGGAQPGDVIVSVNRVDVASAADAIRELNLVEAGRTAFLLVQRGPNRVFLQVLKE